MADRPWRAAEDALVAGDDVALETLLRDHGEVLRRRPVESTWSGGLAPDYTRGDARSIIASEHCFSDWDEFVVHRNALKNSTSPVAQFEAAVDAVISGDSATLEGLLRANPQLIRARSPRTHHSTLLHYVGANGVEGFRQRTPRNIVKVAQILLDAGADINAKADMYGGADTMGLIATSIHPVTAGVQEELMEFLLSRGASVAGASGGTSSSGVINACLANGRREAAEFLAKRGAPLDLEAAAGIGRVDLVQRFFTADGSLAGGATRQQMHDGFSWACEYGRTEVVERLLKNGMDVAARLRPHGQTGLHWAAYGGHAATLGVLLQHQAPVEVNDDTFETTPLGWALHAWSNRGEQPATDSYYEIVEQLVRAGARVDERLLKHDEGAWPVARKINDDTRMRAILTRR